MRVLLTAEEVRAAGDFSKPIALAAGLWWVTSRPEFGLWNDYAEVEVRPADELAELWANRREGRQASYQTGIEAGS